MIPETVCKHGWAAVVGWPVKHSLSPIIHGYWMQKHGIAAQYDKLAVEPQQLAEMIRSLPVRGAAGVNLTVPHKEKAMQWLDRVDVTAAEIGAVNTVVVEEDGTLTGHNTDAYGFWHSVRGAIGTLHDQSALVLGAGGAARAVAFALKEAGAVKIYIANRTPEKAQQLAGALGSSAEAVTWEGISNILPHVALLVNTTTLGMKGQPPLQIDLVPLAANAVVCDIVYAPLETSLLKQARMRGLVTIDGLGMLLYQAQKAFSLWYGILPEVTSELRLKLENEVKSA